MTMGAPATLSLHVHESVDVFSLRLKQQAKTIYEAFFSEIQGSQNSACTARYPPLVRPHTNESPMTTFASSAARRWRGWVAAAILVLAPVTPALQCVPTTRRALLHRTAALSAGCLIAQPTALEAAQCYDPQFKEIPCEGLVEKASGDDVAPESFRKGLGAPVANANMVTVDRATGELVSDTSNNRNAPLRTYIPSADSAETEAASTAKSVKKGKAPSSLDLNNMVGVGTPPPAPE